MNQTVVFSRDRAAQLDLLLRSISTRAPELFGSISVLFQGSNPDYLVAYAEAMGEHPSVNFYCEQSFQPDLERILDYSESEYVTFLCDDDLVVRPFIDSNPERILELNDTLLCFSLRLGNNTNECYPLDRTQEHPSVLWHISDHLIWDWEDGDADWGYPGSLDGHMFRRDDLEQLLDGADYDAPNGLEEALVQRCMLYHGDRPNMACFESSLITGVPINRVQSTHPNRSGEFYPWKTDELNQAFLEGNRLRLDPVDRKDVTAAHTELPLGF